MNCNFGQYQPCIKNNVNNIIALACITNYLIDHEYIEEYCEHYFKLGFDRIYLLDDIHGKDNTKNYQIFHMYRKK